MKKRAVALLKYRGLESLSKGVKNAKGQVLELVFSAKIYKPESPIRASDSERCTWKLVVSRFIQDQLAKLRFVDLFLVRNSEGVVYYLMKDNPGPCSAVSIDVEDLFYSIPLDHLMPCIKQCITDENDEFAVTTTSGTSVETVLSFYLNSTVVAWEGVHFQAKIGHMHRFKS
ncbi:hypothetical protein HPB48_001537 [Haemaphysalis longicornis]|uniref:Uncharacterized protein n=1 Tax=Haemaphysalis longicornis TaxID=44386 RepID=A0A9J6FE59_HAELO|nr:hypothetical protein HPB48_001537 [Haemaphysalis longicornis]